MTPTRVEGRLNPGKAIPTVYGGVTFRSRLEADAAYLFDRLGLGWEYEKRSFLLDNGMHYAPDFLSTSRRLWCEMRGYSTHDGDAQIEGFAGWIRSGRPEPSLSTGAFFDYLVIGPEKATLYEFEGKWGVAEGPAIILRCGNCGSYSFLAHGGDESCKAECDGAGRPAGPDAKWQLGIRQGVIMIGGSPMRRWLLEAADLGFLMNFPRISTGSQIGF